MVTEKSHNSDANITTQTTGVKINNKYRHDREGALSLEVPLKCIINMTEFLEKAKSYALLVTKNRILVDPVELQKFEKRTVSDFVVNKCSLKICLSTKDTVSKSLTSLRVKPQRIIKGKRYFMSYILFPTPSN